MTINERYDAAKAALAAVKDGDDADAIKSAIAEFKAAEDAKKAADAAAALVKSLANTTTAKESDTMPNDAPKTFGEFAAKNLDMNAFANGAKSVATGLNFKAATDPQTSVQVVSYADQPLDTVAREISVRDVFSQLSVSGNTVSYVQMGATEGEPTAVNENGEKPQIHVPTEDITEKLGKVAAWFYESDELLADNAMLRSAIDNRAINEVRNAAESTIITKLLATDGVGRISETPGLDNIFTASMQVRQQHNHAADAVIINPTDYATLRLAKDGNTQYYGGGAFYGPYGQGGVVAQPGIWGLNTIVTTAIPAGTVIVGAFRLGGAVVTKQGEGIGLEVHRGDHDDAIHNRVTVVVEERLAIAVYYPADFVVIKSA